MRERDGGREHEAEGARELDRNHSPSVERVAAHVEGRFAGEELASIREDWARFARENPREGDAFQRDFVDGNNLAYARAVDARLIAETGQGLRELHPPVVDDYDDLMQHVQSRPTREPDAGNATRDRVDEHRTDARNLPPAPAAPPLSPVERAKIQAEAAERIERPATLRPERPPTARPEDWYAARAATLPAPARASVDREVDRLKELPALSTREGARSAVEGVAAEFESARGRGDDQPQLRTRLYALALVHELRVKEDSAREAALEAARVREVEGERDRELEAREVERDDVTEPDVRSLAEQSDEFRSLSERIREEATIADRLITAEGSAPARGIGDRIGRDVARESPALRLDDTSPGRRNVVAPGPERTEPEARPETTNVGRRAKVIPLSGRDQPAMEDTDAGGRNRRASPAQELVHEVEHTVELRTGDFSIERDIDDGRDRDGADATINTRLSAQFRERASARRLALAHIAADASREQFSVQRDAAEDPGAARELRAINTVLDGLRSKMRNQDPYDLAERIAELRQQEARDPEVTDGRYRTERLAYGVLAHEAFERQNELDYAMTRDRLSEIREMSVEERLRFAADAAVLLREPAYNDAHAMQRELARGDDPRVAQVAALTRQTPSLGELERQARWKLREPAFKARVEQRVAERLYAPERDSQLLIALSDARVRAGMPTENQLNKQRAVDEAVELAEVIRQLPISRSTDIETPPSPHRPLSI